MSIDPTDPLHTPTDESGYIKDLPRLMRERACPAGEPWTADDPASDHGHTDCWLYHLAASEIERLRAALEGER